MDKKKNGDANKLPVMSDDELIEFGENKVSNANPKFKIKHFIGRSMITPYQAMKQWFRELGTKQDAWLHCQWEKKRKEIELAQERARLESTEDKFEKEYIEMDILNIQKDLRKFEKNEINAIEEKNSVLECMKELLDSPQGKLKDGTPLLEVFGNKEKEEQQEKEYWTIRMAKQSAMEIMAYGRIGTGNLDSIAMLEAPQQDEVLSIATEYCTKMNNQMNLLAEKKWNDLRIGYTGKKDQERLEQMGIPTSIKPENIMLNNQVENNNALINNKYNEKVETKEIQYSHKPLGEIKKEG